MARFAKVGGIAVVLFAGFGVAWLIALGAMTEGYECGRADVECKGWKEWLGAHGWWSGLACAATLALIVARVAYGRRRS